MIRHPLSVVSGDRYAILLPDAGSRISVEVDAPDPHLERQVCSVGTGDDLSQRVAPARSLWTAERLESLRRRGMARGANACSTVLAGDGRRVDPDKMRFEDELARHGVLDCMGDLQLMGAPLRGHVYAYRPGEGLVPTLIRKLFAYQSVWSYRPVPVPGDGPAPAEAPRGGGGGDPKGASCQRT
jgi:UDP-3-O-[3-hydroxymyristoyl] N-acetylglucosamine deacetylase